MNDLKHRSAYIQVSQRISNTFLKNVIWHDGRCNWVDASFDYNHTPPALQMSSMGQDVYTGLSGILLFFNALIDQNEDPIHTEVASGIVKNLIHTYDQVPIKWSFYTGQIGILYAIAKSQKFYADDEVRDWVKIKLLEIIHEPLEHEQVEVLYGLSSSIVPLSFLLNYFEISNKRNILSRIGDFILHSGISEGESTFWKSSISEHGLTGLSHGSSGICYALLQIYQITESEKYLDAAIKGFHFEDQHFNETVGNWLDLRQNNNEANYAMAWCNGAPGIGLSRLRAWEITGENQWKQQGIHAMNKVVDYIYQYMNAPLESVNFSLCHGLCGNAAILKIADQILQENRFENVIVDVAEFGRYHFDSVGLEWPGGLIESSNMQPLSSLSLMLGSAGIGLFYLSFYENSKMDFLL